MTRLANISNKGNPAGTWNTNMTSVTSQSTALKVQLFGHSFVKRLRDFIRFNNSFRYDLKIQGNPLVQYSGFPGSTVHKIRNNLEVVKDFSPDFVVLIIGTNDLCQQHVTPRSVARSIVDLVDTLLFVIGVKKVIVLQVLHRLQPKVPTKHQVDLDWYNSRVDELNYLLLDMLNHTIHKRSYLWRMKGFWSDTCKQQNFADDGCHLSTQGQVRLMSNIKAAVVAVLKGSICQTKS